MVREENVCAAHGSAEVQAVQPCWAASHTLLPRVLTCLLHPCRRALLEAVKQLKLQELEAAGVPKKYRAQLETMVPMAPQRGGK